MIWKFPKMAVYPKSSKLPVDPKWGFPINVDDLGFSYKLPNYPS